MKFAWVTTTVSAVGCTIAFMVLFGQYGLRTKLLGDEAQQRTKCMAFDAQLAERQFFNNMMQNQLEQQRKDVIGLTEELGKATLEQQQKAEEFDFCKADQKKKEEELAGTKKEQAEVENNLSKESATWAEQIASLKKVKEQPSEVCAFIKKDSVGPTFCQVPGALGATAPGSTAPATTAPAV
ncbi:unnamed protein product [Lota lota]